MRNTRLLFGSRPSRQNPQIAVDLHRIRIDDDAAQLFCKGEREPGKSDQIDALAVARAVVKDGVEQFPVAYLNEQAMEIRLPFDHRRDLVASARPADVLASRADVPPGRCAVGQHLATHRCRLLLAHVAFPGMGHRACRSRTRGRRSSVGAHTYLSAPATEVFAMRGSRVERATDLGQMIATT